MRWASVHRPDQVSRRSASSLLVESISDAIECLDCIEVGVTGTEFPADSLDVAVDRAVVDINVVAISDIEQLVAGFYHSRALRQRFEDQEFGDGQRDVLAVPADLMACWVHRQAPAFQQRRLGLIAGRTGFAARQVL